VSERFTAFGTIYKTIRKPRPEVEIFISIMDKCVTIATDLLISKSAVPKSSLKRHSTNLLFTDNIIPFDSVQKVQNEE